MVAPQNDDQKTGVEIVRKALSAGGKAPGNDEVARAANASAGAFPKSKSLAILPSRPRS